MSALQAKRRFSRSRRLLMCGVLVLVGLLVPRIAFSTDADSLSQATGRQGMVVTVSPPATEAGVAILKAGGNAVDAAIAVEFALAVTWPEAGNIGGGGFMIVHRPDNANVVCIDYREKAPAAAHESTFSRNDGRHSQKIVGVPGTVSGMATAHERFGNLAWRKLLAPAIQLAQEGFPVDSELAKSLNRVLRIESVQNDPRHREFLRVFSRPGGGEWRTSDRLTQPELAATLQRISHSGADGFYSGKTAALLIDEMTRGDGLIQPKDLTEYQAQVRPAIHGRFRDFDIYGAPPPSSGGTCLVQMLNMLEGLDLRKHPRFSRDALHLMTETMKRAYCDRARYLGDADFVTVPQRLTQKPYARKLASSISPKRATASETLAPEIQLKDESPETTHFSIIDADGMAVSNTTTLEGRYGARIVVKGAGFVLNNEMGDFNWFPGHTDRAGRIGTEPNRIQPGKRMLSSQSPTVVAKNGRPVLITGSPGGRTIINTTLQMVLNVVEFNMSLPEAMLAPRIHHQWLPDKVAVETYDERFGVDLVNQLISLGHRVEPRSTDNYQGSAHSILINADSGEYHGVADWRRGGTAAGF